jgi:hypothetical protein
MTVQIRPLTEVTRRAIEVLTRELGSADTLRFIKQFTTGIGNYTAEREQLFGEESLDQLLAAAKAKAAERPVESALSKET